MSTNGKTMKTGIDVGSASVSFDVDRIPATIAEAKRIVWATQVRTTLKDLAAFRPYPTRPLACSECGVAGGAHWGSCSRVAATVIKPESEQIQRVKSPHKGRAVRQFAHQEYRAPSKATLPARNLRLPDGRLLVYQGPDHDGINGGWWITADGLRVCASIDPDPVYGRFLHLSISYFDRDPSWEDILQVRYTFYPLAMDVMMILPADGHYVNINQHVFQLRPTPERWSYGEPMTEARNGKAGKRITPTNFRKGK